MQQLWRSCKFKIAECTIYSRSLSLSETSEEKKNTKLTDRTDVAGAVNIFFTLLTVDSTEIKEMYGIQELDKLEFDHDSNAYGVETRPTDSRLPWSKYMPTRSFFFKLDADRNLVWKIELEFSIPDKILINAQNEVYLIFEKQIINENHRYLYEVHVPDTRDGRPILKKISEFTSREGISNDIFLIGDNIIIFDLSSYDDCVDLTNRSESPTLQRSTIKAVKAKSGKELTVASSLGRRYEPFPIVKDPNQNIYFSKKTYCGSNRLCTKFVVLTEESLREGFPELVEIEEAIDSPETEVVTGLNLGNDREIYIETYDSLFSRYKIKKLKNYNVTNILYVEGNPFDTYSKLLSLIRISTGGQGL